MFATKLVRPLTTSKRFIRKFSDQNNIKNISKFISTIKSYDYFSSYVRITIFITKITTAGGSIFGVYHGYQCSKNESYFDNCLATIGGFVLGGTFGSFMGLLWNLTIPVFIMRNFVEKKLNFHELNPLEKLIFQN